MKTIYPLRLIFDCSVAHLSPDTRAWLDVRAVDAGTRRLAEIDAPSATPFGWFLWAEARPGPEMPSDLALVMRYARRLGAEYVLFDADAPPNGALPIFEDPG